MDKPKLYIFSGLPGVGKSTLGTELSKATGFTYLRIDTLEQGLRDFCGIGVEGEGYQLAYQIAQDNLNLGTNVIADSCNPIHLTRSKWIEVATNSNADYINIEVLCSDRSEHRYRVEHRESCIPGLKPPSWESVNCREYDAWSTSRFVIDTAGKSISHSAQELFAALKIEGT